MSHSTDDNQDKILKKTKGSVSLDGFFIGSYLNRTFYLSASKQAICYSLSVQSFHMLLCPTNKAAVKERLGLVLKFIENNEDEQETGNMGRTVKGKPKLENVP